MTARNVFYQMELPHKVTTTLAKRNLRGALSDRLLSTLAFDLSAVASGMHAVVIVTPTEQRYVPVVVGK